MFKLDEFVVRGLHGRQHFSIPINENRLVLVGVNGLGKTTVVNLLFFMLTRQWWRLLQYEFDEIELRTGKTKYSVRRDDLLSFSSREISARLQGYLPASVLRKISREPDLVVSILTAKPDTADAYRLCERLRIPPSMLRRISERVSDSRSALLIDDDNLRLFDDDNPRLLRLTEFLRANLNAQVLYLPTYRRIEQDLKAIFPHISDHVFEHADERIESLESGESGYIELVQFGMQDVEKKILRAQDAVKEDIRTELNNLAGSYLRDVIRGHANTYDKTVIKGLDDAEISNILARVEEKTLTEADKTKLRGVIDKLQDRKVKKVSMTDKHLAHFFTRLIAIYRRQQNKEKHIRQFIDVCNKYIQGKRLVYDELNYSMQMRLPNDDSIALKHLSSGEKQIVSLLSHIYLSNEASYVVLIDEPELSLSVEWQKRLLPDIVNSGRCHLLIAATHSPFIFDNEFDDKTKDLRECIRVGK